MVGPRSTTISRTREHHWFRGEAETHSSKRNIAKVNIAEKWTRFGVISPDAFFIGEECRILLGDNHWGEPCARITGCCRGQIISARDRSCLRAFEGFLRPQRAEV